MGGAGDRYTTEAWLCPLTVPASVPALARLPLAYLRPHPTPRGAFMLPISKGGMKGRVCVAAPSGSLGRRASSSTG